MDADVIVVGGRPAGASLAARLGKRGIRTLVLERADLPSAPNVPSCPTLHMGTLAMLDDLEVSESAYGPGAVRFEHIVIAFGDWFTAPIRIPTVHGRDYGYSILRPRFDETLWEHLARYPGVTRRRFRVSGLLRDATGAVVGVEGQEPGGAREELRAPWVVGADGRFSQVAGWVGAKVVEESAEQVSTVYFTDWEGLAPLAAFGEMRSESAEAPLSAEEGAGSKPANDEDGRRRPAEAGGRREHFSRPLPKPGAPTIVQVHATGRGLNVLFFPVPDGRTTICVHIRADRVPADGDGERFYHDTLRSIPAVAARLRDARPVTPFLGMKRVGNGYRTASGPGWMLVGDAFHYKDPVDGQGIYDAFLGTRIAAEELARSLAGECAPAAAADAYARRAYDATHPMFAATVKRLATELYSEPPVPVIRTLLRWMLTDRVYQERFMRFLGREIDPARWMGPGLMAGAVVRGIAADLRGRPAPRIGMDSAA